MASFSQPHLVLVPEALEPGDVVGGKYEIEDQIAQGGMGVVYRARQLDLDVRVALKVIRPELLGDEAAVERFLREARMAAGLRSPHVAHVFDFGRLPSGAPYLIMELLEGSDLAQVLREQGPLSIPLATRAVIEAALALSDAHALGIVHRDLKPENLFLAHQHDGSTLVKIVDFGIAKLSRKEGERSITMHGAVGSPNYMAPEQMLYPDWVDTRSDVWALGAVLFELLTGRAAIQGRTVAEVCAKVLTEPVPHISTIRLDVPPELDAIIFRCMAQNPDERFATARDLADALQPFANLPSAVSVAPVSPGDAAVERAFFDSEPPPELAFHDDIDVTEAEPASVPIKPRWPVGIVIFTAIVALGATAFAVVPRSYWQPLLAGSMRMPELGADVDDAPVASSWTLRELPMRIAEARAEPEKESADADEPIVEGADQPAAPAAAPAPAPRAPALRARAVKRAAEPVAPDTPATEAPSTTPRPELRVPTFDEPAPAPSGSAAPTPAPTESAPSTPPSESEEPKRLPEEYR